jgi:hypothetical protein
MTSRGTKRDKIVQVFVVMGILRNHRLFIAPSHF